MRRVPRKATVAMLRGEALSHGTGSEFQEGLPGMFSEEHVLGSLAFL